MSVYRALNCVMMAMVALYVPLVLADEIASKNQSDVKRAQLLFEADRPDAARSIYQALLRQQLADWEKAIIHYNLGTIDLSQELWEQALAQLNAVPLATDIPAWLMARLSINKAAALIGLAREMLTDVLPKTAEPDATLDQLSSLMAQAKSALATATTAHCALAAPHACTTPDDIQQFNAALQELQSQLSTAKETRHVTNLPVIDLVGTLMVRFENQASTASKAIYWNVLQKQLPKEIPANAATLDEAQALSLLNQIYAKYLPQEPPEAAALSKLRLAYAKAIGAESLSLKMLQEITPLDPATDLSQLAKDRLALAQTAQEVAIKALEQNQTGEARRAAEIGARWLDLTLLAVPEFQPATPIDWLESMIFLQHALNELSNPPVGGLQQAILQTTDPFMTAIKQEQALRYAKAECQKTPWSTALPFFFDGYTYAQQANTLSRQPHATQERLEELQRRVVSSWRLALAELKSPSESEKTPPQPNQSSAPERTQSKAIPLPQTIQWLQEMESEDRPRQQTNPTSSGVLRPW